MGYGQSLLVFVLESVSHFRLDLISYCICSILHPPILVVVLESVYFRFATYFGYGVLLLVASFEMHKQDKNILSESF